MSLLRLLLEYMYVQYARILDVQHNLLLEYVLEYD